MSASNKASSGWLIVATGVMASRVRRSGSFGDQAGGSFVSHHDQR